MRNTCFRLLLVQIFIKILLFNIFFFLKEIMPLYFYKRLLLKLFDFVARLSIFPLIDAGEGERGLGCFLVKCWLITGNCPATLEKFHIFIINRISSSGEKERVRNKKNSMTVMRISVTAIRLKLHCMSSKVIL